MNEASDSARTLFLSALEIADAGRRSAFVAQACGSDATLRQEVEELLAAEAAAGKFLPERPGSFEGRAGRREGEIAGTGTGAGGNMSGGTTVWAPVTEKAGDRVGRYKLQEKLGEGGCGVVYVAEQEEPVRRRVALKVIKLGMDTRNVVARFEAERQALAMMDHPNIAKVLDAGATDSGRPYFVMELVRGIKITDYCDENQLDTGERLQLFIQVCRAVQHAHQKGIIHRDLKPSNILVTLHDGVPVPKVIDFGIAKATEGRLTDLTVYTELHQFIGTPAYMSPEQAEMSGLDIDTRSDIYSLGVLLYELLTGRTPFDPGELLRAGLDQMRRTIREQEPVRPSTRLSTMLEGELTTAAKRRRAEAPKLIHLVRGDLDWIAMKALEKDRTRRYETANGLAMDIKRFLDNEPVVARPPAKLYLLVKFARRNKLAFGAGAAVAGALLVGLVASSLMFLREQQARQEADRARRAERDQKNEARRHEQEALAAQAKAEQQRERTRELSYASDVALAWVALKENNLAEVASLLEAQTPQTGERDLRDWEWRYLWQACQGEQLWTLGPVGVRPRNPMRTNSAGREIAVEHINAVSLLPGGNLITGSEQPNGGIRIWDLETRRELRASSVPDNISGLAISPDGRQLAVAGWHRKVRFLGANTLETAGELEHTNPIWSVVFSPNGRLLSAHGPQDVSVWDLATGSRLWATNIPKASRSCAGFSPDGQWLACQIGDDESGPMAVLDATNGVVLGITENRVEGLSSPVVVSPDGQRLAWGDWQGFVILADPRLSRVKPLGKHSAPVFALGFSPSGQQLATAGADRVVRLWDVASGQERASFRGHRKEVTSLTFSPGGDRLYTSGADGTVRAWPTTPPTHRAGLAVPHPLFAGTLSRNGRYLAGWDTNWVCHAFDAETLAEVASVKIQQRAQCAALGPDGRQIALGHADGTIAVRDLMEGRGCRSFLAHSNQVDALAFSPDGTLLASAARGAEVCVWQAARSEPLLRRVLGGPDYQVRDMAVAADNSLLAVPAWGRIHLISLNSNGGEDQIEIGEALCIDLSPDGSLVAAGTFEEVGVWEVSSKRPIATLHGSRGAFNSVSFSPNGRRLAGCDGRGVTWVWDLTTGREVARFELAYGHARFQPNGNVLALSQSPEGASAPFQILRAPSWADIAKAQ